MRKTFFLNFFFKKKILEIFSKKSKINTMNKEINQENIIEDVIEDVIEDIVEESLNESYDNLFKEAKNGNVEEVEKRLKKLDNYEDGLLWEILAVAAENNNKELVVHMINIGISQFDTAIRRAEKAGFKQMADFIAEKQEEGLECRS